MKDKNISAVPRRHKLNKPDGRNPREEKAGEAVLLKKTVLKASYFPHFALQKESDRTEKRDNQCSCRQNC